MTGIDLPDGPGKKGSPGASPWLIAGNLEVGFTHDTLVRFSTDLNAILNGVTFEWQL